MVSLSVVGYSIADGIGSRVSNNPIHYIVWLFALDGWIFLLLMQITYGWYWNHFTKKDILEIGFGSLIAILGYGIVIYTMAYISFAYVSARRETSVILAALIGIFYLKESGKFFRIISAIIVFIGIYFIYQN